MRYIQYILLLILFLSPVLVQADEINNIIDGKRDGFWRIEGKNGKVEEGNYTAGNKTGIWKTTNKDGIVICEITFTNGEAIGEATMYFNNGSIMEKGFWNIDHWEGSYERYHETGKKACQFTYDNRGRREGRQLYFHENGKVLYDGEWKGGKIIGALSVFNNEGQKVMERVYDESGKFQGSSDAQLPPAQNSYDNFTGTGNFTLFNLNGKVERKGDFNNGKLINGERYVYDDKGKLKYTEVYRNGEMIGKK